MSSLEWAGGRKKVALCNRDSSTPFFSLLSLEVGACSPLWAGHLPSLGLGFHMSKRVECRLGYIPSKGLFSSKLLRIYLHPPEVTEDTCAHM